MMERLQEAKNMEAEEKLKLEEEIMEKQKMVQKIQDEVAAKDEETKKLQEQIELAKRKEEEYKIQQQKAEEERLREKERLEEEARHRAELESVPDNDKNQLPEVSKVDENLQEQLKVIKFYPIISTSVGKKQFSKKNHWINFTIMTPSFCFKNIR